MRLLSVSDFFLPRKLEQPWLQVTSYIECGKGPGQDDPVNKVKLIVRNAVDGIFDDFMSDDVFNRDDLYRLGRGVNLIVHSTGNLVENIAEKTEKARKNFMSRLCNTKKQLSLKSLPEYEDSESEKTSTSSSSTESEDESEESSDEEKAESAQALTFTLADPQETQGDQHDETLKLCSRDHFKELTSKMADEIYPVMESEGRTRLALIICNKEFKYLSDRYGCEVDLLRMQNLLKNLGYLVVVKKNLTAQDMETELRCFAARQEHQSSDSTFLVFMSHGILGGICGTKHRNKDPDILHDDTIFKIFNNRNCRNLKDKPKVIIMQACRGKGSGSVWTTTDGVVMADALDQSLQCYVYNDAVTKAHVERDFIAFKSSTPHNVSWRLGTNGSRFISQLIKTFKEYSCSHHLEDIFQKVQHSFEIPDEQTQMPTREEYP
ncbi:caspase-12-like [Tupaia chinensis]|uniref:caspase-12-like n=1 Tax=Tupaia chinensis TaxID=246437 RepID=UPI000FFB96B6|nr:caspase-12-like [Tupaia chinensis]